MCTSLVKGFVSLLPSRITLTLALSHQRERGEDPTPDSSRGLGMTGGWGGGGGCAFRRNGFTPWHICDLPLKE